MKILKNNNRTSTLVAISVALTAIASIVHAAPVALQNATATFSQTYSSDFSVGRAINGTFVENLGWSVYEPTSATTSAQTAVFETTANVGFAGGSLLTFKLYQTHGIDFAKHTLGRFRLSVTTDDRSLFADGLATGGDVTANWTVLNPSAFVSSGGATLSKLGDFSILASGVDPDFDTYTVTAPTTLTGITGVRLEALEDPSLPFSGPGRQPSNGNFELSEFTVDITAVPEPNTLTLLSVLSVVIATARRKNQQ